MSNSNPKNQFKKGCVPWNKGKKNIYSIKTLIKMRKAKKGLYKGIKHPRWNGGKYKDGDGYIYIYKPEHPFCSIKGYVMEHRLVMEKHLNRFLQSQEVVHHLNINPSDNRIGNLKLFINNVEHLKFHRFLSGKIGIYRNCIKCNKKFYIPYWRISDKKRGKYCNLICFKQDKSRKIYEKLNYFYN